MSYKSLLLLLFALFSFSLFAQQKLLIMQDVVYPNKVDQYEKAQKDVNDWLVKNNMGVTWTCLERDNFIYTYTIPIDNYAKIDEIDKMWAEKMKNVNQDEFKKYAGAFIGNVAHTNEFVLTKDDKGSYLPETPYTKYEDRKFYHWDYFEVIPGMEDQALAILEQEAALSKKDKMGIPFNLWRMSIGDNTSALLFASYDKSRVDFFTNLEKDNKLGGKEMDDLDKKFMAMVQKFDHWNGKLRDDLSIKPVVLSEEKK